MQMLMQWVPSVWPQLQLYLPLLILVVSVSGSIVLNNLMGRDCEAKAKDNVPPVTNFPGFCKWGCPICLCHCSCSFSEPNRMTIALGRRKMKERELKVSKKQSAAEN